MKMGLIKRLGSSNDDPVISKEKSAKSRNGRDCPDVEGVNVTIVGGTLVMGDAIVLRSVSAVQAGQVFYVVTQQIRCANMVVIHLQNRMQQRQRLRFALKAQVSLGTQGTSLRSYSAGPYPLETVASSESRLRNNRFWAIRSPDVVA